MVRAHDDGAGRRQPWIAVGRSGYGLRPVGLNARAASSILSTKVKLGGDASAAAGPVGRTASAETDVALRAEILSYSRARGLFAGISLSGSTLRPDNSANKNLYGKDVTAKQIVFDRAVPAPPSAKLLLSTLNKRTPRRK